ncbi:hypothetical protein M0R45_027534 [Rubus argutus]|uniref:SPRY domain-containing protein n=1 Tax=Rubus argutus TaxID=59490 RepID=A0AAW1X460_RUBAR
MAEFGIGYHFIIEGHGLKGSSLYEQGLAYCWSGARANVGITGGKYCFGCKVVLFQAVKMEDTGPNQQNLCRVGISRGDDVVGSLGETSRSFGYEGTGKFLNARKLSDYGEMFGLGDIIICAVNLEEKPLASISFSKNGKRLADYVLHVSKDMPGSDELFDEVMFVELNREESQRRLDEMQEEVSNLNLNSSSPYSCRDCVQSYPFSPNYGESPVWPYPMPSPQYIGASAVSTGSWSNSYSSVSPNYQYHMLNQVNTYQTHQGAVLVGTARSFSEPYEGNPRPPAPSFVTPQGTYSGYPSTPTAPYSSYGAGYGAATNPDPCPWEPCPSRGAIASFTGNSPGCYG